MEDSHSFCDESTRHSTPTNMVIVTTPEDSPNSVTTTSSITALDPDGLKERCLNLEKKLSSVVNILEKIKANQDDPEMTVADLVEDNEKLTKAVQLARQQNMYWEELSNNTSSYSSKKSVIKEAIKKNRSLLRVMRDAMNQCVTPYCKFATKQMIHSLADNSIGVTIMKQLNVPKKDWHTWWATNQILAEGLITEHKTSTTQAMKNNFNKGEICYLLQ